MLFYTISDDLRYDFIIFKVENNNLVFCKTFEIQGEGHFEPIFGITNFIKTILSDAIKKDFWNNNDSFFRWI